jgi:formylglycine-generating enzyme required for sulfatase activity
MMRFFLYVVLLVLFTGDRVGASDLSPLLSEELPPPLPAVVNETLCRTCHAAQPVAPPPELASNPECLKCHNAGVIPIEATLVKNPIRRDAPPMRSSKRRVVTNRMVLIPAGTFVMGDDHFKKAVQPRHEMYVNAFYIDRYDVTNEEYKVFVDATGHRPLPSHWRGDRYPPGKENHPVIFVSWFDANDYCHWAGERLPSEAEWEKAARGTDGRTYPWGNKLDMTKANIPYLRIGDTTPVDRFEHGKSPYGVYDMAGNVFQWTADWFKSYAGNDFHHPNFGGMFRVLRGGSYYDCSYYHCGPSFPTYNRIALTPETRAVSLGFRCARTP